MFYLALLWAIVSILSVLLGAYRLYTRKVAFMSFVQVLAVYAIGLLIFPKYLTASVGIQNACFYGGLIVLSLSFILVFGQQERKKQKSRT